MVFTAAGDAATTSAPLLPSISDDASGAVGRSSELKTFANVLISIVGAGVLGLPYTFSRTGWASALLLLTVVSAATVHCMLLLVATRRRLADGAKIGSFGDLAAVVAGPIGRLAVDVMIVLSQAGFCAGYLIFISNTLAHIFPNAAVAAVSAKAVVVAGVLPFQLGLNSIKTLTLLAPLSIFADAVDLAAKTAVMAQDVGIWASNRPPVRAFGSPSSLLYGLGVAVYAFEGIGMILPLEAEAAEKSKFGRALGLSMGFITSLYALFGLLGYLAFGADTADIITTNFGGGVLTVAVQLGLVINLFFTFPVMMNPVYEVLERRITGKRYCWPLRWAVVVVVSLVATLVPNFTDFLSLVGSSVCCVLGFVLPAAFHLKVFGNELGWVGMTGDIAIVVLGTFVTISGTWTSLMAIINTSQV